MHDEPKESPSKQEDFVYKKCGNARCPGKGSKFWILVSLNQGVLGRIPLYVAHI